MAPPTPHASSTAEDIQPGTLIAGKYKLLEAIGEGGMGAVWMAQQIEPVKRHVALKLIKSGMDSKRNARPSRYEAAHHSSSNRRSNAPRDVSGAVTSAFGEG